MATYRLLALIPVSAIPPGTTDPVTMSDENLTHAMNSAANLADQMHRYSAGMMRLDVSIRVVMDTIGPDQYSFRDDGVQYYVAPGKLAAFTGDAGTYDIVFVYSDPQATNASTFRGLTTMDGCWTIAGVHQVDMIGPHELMHWFTVTLGAKGYANFPSCGVGVPAAHCGTDYGFPDDLNEGWLTAFFSATLPDGSGIDATGWELPTPTDDGLRTIPYAYQPRPSPWGMIGVLNVPDPATP